MKNIYIWGAGEWGRQAYWYYKDRGNILGYIDTDRRKIDTYITLGRNIVKIFSPEILCNNKFVTVIIAVKQNNGIEAIVNSFGIEDIVYFSIEQLEMRSAGIRKEVNESRSIDLGAFLSELEKIRINVSFIPFSSGVLDYAFIRAIALKYNVKKYLEIGTFIGESIKSVSDICEECYSITLAKEESNSCSKICEECDMPDFSNKLANDDNVKHFYIDAKEMDWSQISSDIDLYFIDGDHSYAGVYCDTKNVFAHRKKDSIVIWHDFKKRVPTFSDIGLAVPQAIKDALLDDFKNVYCVNGNQCAIYLPKKYQKDFKLRSLCYTKKEQPLYVYETEIKCKLLEIEK